MFYWRLHLIAPCRRLSKVLQIVPTLPPVESRAEASASCAHAHKISDIQFSLVILNYNEYLCFVIWRLLSALFIYLFFFYSFNFLMRGSMKLQYGPENLDNGMSENEQNIRQSHQLHLQKP